MKKLFFRIIISLLILFLFNFGYWGLRIWGHGLYVVYLALAALVWWRYPTRMVRIRIAILLGLQFCFDKLPEWLPAAYGGGDGGYTAGLFLYWPLNLRSLFITVDLGGERSAIFYTIIAFLGAFLVLPVITYFRGKRFYCTMLCRWALIAETLGEPFRSRAPKGTWAQRLQVISVGIFVLVVGLTVLKAVGFNQEIGSRSLVQWYHLVFIYYLTFQVSVAVIPVLGGRAKCRYNCPMGVFLGFFQKLGRFRLSSDTAKCKRCGNCDRICDMGISVMNISHQNGRMNSSQCTGCGLCVAVFPTQSLNFSYDGDKNINLTSEISR